MYGKIFDSMYTGTLHGHWEAIVTFQQMIVLSDADGIVDITPAAIAAVTSIPLEIITKGLAVLEAPDEHTRTPGFEGRRLELIDAHRPWGWRIVNHQKYKMLVDADTVREQNRERQRRHRASKSGNAVSRSVTDSNASNAPSRHTDTDTDTNTLFDRFWKSYPRKEAKKSALKAFLKLKLENGDFEKVLAALEIAKKSQQWVRDGGKFIPHPATWLNGRRFEDEGTQTPKAEFHL